MHQKSKLPHSTAFMSGKDVGLDWLIAISVNDYVSARHLNWHRHDEIEIICPVKGHYQYEFEDRPPVAIDRNAFLVIPRNMRHRLSEAIDTPGFRFSLHLANPGSRAKAKTGGVFSSQEYRQLCNGCSTRAVRGIPMTQAQRARVALLAKLVADDDAATDEFGKLQIRLLCGQLLFDVASSKSKPSEKRKVLTDVLSQAAKWLERYHGNHVDMDELIDYIGYSRARFFTLFKQYHGVTPCEYLRNIRISKAKELLATTGRSAIRIARECGLGDPAHFNRLFRKMTAQTPLAYRRAHS